MRFNLLLILLKRKMMENQNNKLFKINNTVRVPCSLDKSFFKFWFMFLEPYHHLTNREIDVAASFVKQRYELSKVIQDNNILDKVSLSDDIKRKVREECNITLAHFQVIMGKLRKNKVIENNRINPKFIPNIKPNDDNSFKLLLLFELK